MQPRRYLIRARCDMCDQEFSWIAKSPAGKNKPCPNQACKDALALVDIAKRQSNIATMLDERRPPGHIGQSVIVKAADETARIVMEDHGMTDLKDNVRVGESVAPKLPPEQQKAADQFFGGNGMSKRQQNRMEALGKRALAGGLRSMSVSPGQLMPQASPGQPIFRSVGTERIK